MLQRIWKRIRSLGTNQMVMIIAIFVIGIFTFNFLSSNITFNVVDEKAPYIEIVSPLDSEIDLGWNNVYLAGTGFGGIPAPIYVFKVEIVITIFDDQGLSSYYIYAKQGNQAETLLRSYVATGSDINNAGGAIYNIRVASMMLEWRVGYLPTSREFTLRIIASDGTHTYTDTLAYTLIFINTQVRFYSISGSVDQINEEQDNVPPPPPLFEPIPEPETTSEEIGIFGTATTATERDVGIPELFFLTLLALVMHRRKRNSENQ